MSQFYTAPYAAGQAFTAALDAFELLAGTGKTVVVHEIRLAQITEVGDAQEEFLTVILKRGVGSVTSGSGGSTVTPAKLETGSAAAASSVEVYNTTQLAVGTGTLTPLLTSSWNVRSEWLYLPTPETRIVLVAGERLSVGLSAPADSVTLVGTLIFEEIG
jgi:hypothetical protein